MRNHIASVLTLSLILTGCNRTGDNPAETQPSLGIDIDLPEECSAWANAPTNPELHVRVQPPEKQIKVGDKMPIMIEYEIINYSDYSAVETPIDFSLFLDSKNVAEEIDVDETRNFLNAHIPLTRPSPDFPLSYNSTQGGTAFIYAVPESWVGEVITVEIVPGVPKAWCIDATNALKPALTEPPEQCSVEIPTNHRDYGIDDINVWVASLVAEEDQEVLSSGIVLHTPERNVLAWNVHFDARILFLGEDVTARIHPDLPKQLTDVIIPIADSGDYWDAYSLYLDPPEWLYEGELGDIAFDITITQVEGWCYE